MKTEDLLQKYEFEDEVFVTNFKSFVDAEKYATEHGGELTEVAFLDGHDTPELSGKAHLVEERKTFKVEIPNKNYDIYYSYEDTFQELLKTLQYHQKRLENDMYLEDILADQNLASGEKILILDKGTLVTITTRERIKYLMKGHVYELAVKIPKKHKSIYLFPES